MQSIFSQQHKIETWRKLWIALAKGQQGLGIPITNEQITELETHRTNIPFAIAKQKEKEIRHEVMAQIYAYGTQCPKAAGIIHLGATSAYVIDNTDIILMKEALQYIQQTLYQVIHELSKFAKKYASLPILSYTHYQAAQPTTLGKRASLWLQDLIMDVDQLEYVLGQLKLLGCRGATGTSASFLALFQQDEKKVRQLENFIIQQFGFKEAYAVSGQTYSRKVDAQVVNVLASIAQSASKFSNDIRLMMHDKEVDEPFEEQQIGSSAMPYKRNPMRSERMASLARYVLVQAFNPALTASNQWLERTLDDSANKRMSVPEAFLATDGILSLYHNVIQGLVVYPLKIKKNLDHEIGFMMLETILMHAVRKGGNRQELHEALRKHSIQVAKSEKEGKKNLSLKKQIIADPQFMLSVAEWNRLEKESALYGMAVDQTKVYLKQVDKRCRHVVGQTPPTIEV
jgi:adenylosuccinate lyase